MRSRQRYEGGRKKKKAGSFTAGLALKVIPDFKTDHLNGVSNLIGDIIFFIFRYPVLYVKGCKTFRRMIEPAQAQDNIPLAVAFCFVIPEDSHERRSWTAAGVTD